MIAAWLGKSRWSLVRLARTALKLARQQKDLADEIAALKAKSSELQGQLEKAKGMVSESAQSASRVHAYAVRVIAQNDKGWMQVLEKLELENRQLLSHRLLIAEDGLLRLH